VEDTDGGIGRMCVENRDRTVQRHRGGGEVLEDVGVVQTVWVGEGG
jgi:hypothetical protein